MTLANCGTYGLAVLLFAYGEAGFTLGVVYMLTSSLMQATPRCSAPTASSVRC